VGDAAAILTMFKDLSNSPLAPLHANGDIEDSASRVPAARTGEATRGSTIAA
jgi:hypothetical protein